MNRITKNVIANSLGGSWNILLTLVAIPLQIRLLGAEAYGLIGFVASLQSILVVFDFGIPTTIIREVARDSSPNYGNSRDLVQTSHTIYWAVAGLFALIIFVGADWISQHWLTVVTLSPAYVAGGIRITAFYVLFTWPLNIYVGIFSGLQQLKLLNLLRAISVTATQLGGIIILLLKNDLYVFLYWMTFVSFINFVAHVYLSRRAMPGLKLGPRFSIPVIRHVWRFSFDMNVISTLSVVFTQADRLLISTLLPLNFLGYYNLAFNLTRGILALQAFFTSALLPALANNHSQGDEALLKLRYNKFAQLMIYVVALPSFALMFFGHIILTAWTSTDVVTYAYPVVVLLALGALLNTIVSAPYILSIAAGHSYIPLTINLVGVLIYVPVLYFLIIFGGIVGAAIAWVLINLYYTIVQIPWTQRRTLHENSSDYFAYNVLPFLALGGLFWVGNRLVGANLNSSSLQSWLIIMIICVLYVVIGFLFLDKTIQRSILNIPSGLRIAFLKRER